MNSAYEPDSGYAWGRLAAVLALMTIGSGAMYIVAVVLPPLQAEHGITRAQASAGARVGTVLMATLFGMALGGWMSGEVFDLTGSYRAAFANGVGWNLVNLTVVLILLGRLWSSAPAQPVPAT